MASKLIVALDYPTKEQALKLVDQIQPNEAALKIGHELFTRYGTTLVKTLVDKQFKVFLDLKLHDIPNTVAQACKVVADLGIWMVNVHACGGLRMMEAANKALQGYGTDKPLLIAVTVLTSFDQQDLLDIGVEHPLENQVQRLSLLTQQAGLDGVVCSAHEVKALKQTCRPSFLAVTPGIRPQSAEKQDQVRTMTPQQAIQQGCDYLVIGRPITQAENPRLVINEILPTLEN